MSTNSSQPAHSASELFIENTENQLNIDQLLSVETVSVSQPLSSTQFNPTNMIANIQQHNNEVTRQHPRQERHNQQEFQRREDEQQRLRQEQQQQRQHERQRRHRESREHRYEQRTERENQRQSVRDQREREKQDHYAYLQRRSPSFDEQMDEILQERQLDLYYLERMTPERRKQNWEQEHLTKIQGNPTPRTHGLPLNNTERYAIFLHDQLSSDKHDQAMRVYDMLNNNYTQECIRNEELLMQNEEWEETAFRLRQLQ